MRNTDQLLQFLALEKTEENIFIGQSSNTGSPNIYGGQVLAQSLSAAYETVGSDRIAHSLHSYFLLPGDKTKPVEYRVEKDRDGQSFSLRTVRAYQNQKEIFMAIFSFQIEEKNAMNHQFKKPFVWRIPSFLFSWHQYARLFGNQLPKRLKEFLMIERPIEFKIVEIERLVLNFIKHPPRRKLWFRFFKSHSDIDYRKVQQMLLYASDYYLLFTALDPHIHNHSVKQMGKLQVASIDHAMWFHRKFDPTEWLLYDLDSPSASNSRGFTRGCIYTKSGTLVASVAQEGLMRKPSH